MKELSFYTFVSVKFLKSIISVIMIGVLMFSSMGFSVNRHYCMGMMVEENYYLALDNCSMDIDDHCKKPGLHIENNCCDDEIISLPGISVKKTNNDAEETLLIPDWRPFLLNSIIFKISLTEEKACIPFPLPPPLSPENDILIEVQRFLI